MSEPASEPTIANYPGNRLAVQVMEDRETTLSA
jgi:hypothetical protein